MGRKASDLVNCKKRAVPAPIATAIEGAARVLVLTHHNPDGDALGSGSALVRMLNDQGRKAALHLAGEWSGHLHFLLEGLPIDSNPKASQYDLIFILDCHNYDRVNPEGAGLAAELKALPLVVIDHHQLEKEENAGNLWLHDSAASSTGELVWQLACSLGWRPSVPAVQGLLLAITSDTGFFGQGNTTPEALRAAADLMELGGDLSEIKRRVMQDQPLRRYKLMGRVLDSLELHFQGRLATMVVSPDMLQASGAELADTENFVELGRDLAGVSISALIKDSGQGLGSVRVSLRSREGIDAHALASSFGGGGHLQASAYNDKEARDGQEALKHLLARAQSYL